MWVEGSPEACHASTAVPGLPEMGLVQARGNPKEHHSGFTLSGWLNLDEHGKVGPRVWTTLAGCLELGQAQMEGPGCSMLAPLWDTAGACVVLRPWIH